MAHGLSAGLLTFLADLSFHGKVVIHHGGWGDVFEVRPKKGSNEKKTCACVKGEHQRTTSCQLERYEWYPSDGKDNTDEGWIAVPTVPIVVCRIRQTDAPRKPRLALAAEVSLRLHR